MLPRNHIARYPLKMSAFVSALRGALIEKTFLFLGFSFTDPNLDYILSRVCVLHEKHQRHHDYIQKKSLGKSGKVLKNSITSKLKQDYFIRDLKRFGIQTVLVDEYADITSLLEKVVRQYKRSSVFICFSSWLSCRHQQFYHIRWPLKCVTPLQNMTDCR